MPALAPSLDARPRPGAEQVTTKRFGERFRGKLGFDGLFSDNIPRFTDNARPQLVFDLGKVQYALSALVQATDPCIDLHPQKTIKADLFITKTSAIVLRLFPVKKFVNLLCIVPSWSGFRPGRLAEVVCDKLSFREARGGSMR